MALLRLVFLFIIFYIVYAALKPHIAALPPSVRTINVCTADGYLLDALFALNDEESSHVEYSLLSADDMAQRRDSDCFPRRSSIAAGSTGSIGLLWHPRGADTRIWRARQLDDLVGGGQVGVHALPRRLKARKLHGVTLFEQVRS